MKNNPVKAYKICSLGIALIFIFSCASYTKKMEGIQASYKNSDYKDARIKTDELIQKAKQRDRNVILLERAKISFAGGDLASAKNDFQEAEKNLVSLEGTYSITEEPGSIILDDTIRTYTASGFEQTMISPYLALCYYLSNDLAGAIVERNSTINKISQYIEKNNYDFLENPFARLISAIFYIMENKLDDARIEFQKIHKTTGISEFNLTDNQIGDIMKDNAVFIFIENGVAPIKKEKKETIPVGTILVNIVYPVYEKRNSRVEKNEIYLDGNLQGDAEIIYNLDDAVIKHFNEAELTAIRTRMIARAAAKAGIQAASEAYIVNEEVKKDKKDRMKKADNDQLAALAIDISAKVSAAMERADTRSWLSLPAKINYFSLKNLPPGKHSIEVVAKNRSGAIIKKFQKKVDIAGRDKKIEYFIVPE